MTSSAQQKTLVDYVGHWAHVAPSRPALRAGDEDLTYAQLDTRVEQMALELAHRGVEPDARVMLLGLNTVPWVAAFLAVMRIGAVIAPTNNQISTDQVGAQADVLSADFILYDEHHEDLVAPLGQADVRIVDLCELDRDARLRPIERGQWKPIEGTSAALVSFTSGTTGTPKGATISHRALTMMARSFASYFETTPEDSTLVMVPMFHNTGFVDQLGHLLVAGGSIGLLERFSTRAAIAELKVRPVTFLAAVPSMVRMMMIADGAAGIFTTLRTIMYGGSAMPGAWSAELIADYPHLSLVHAYGLSEFTSVCTFLPAHLVSTLGESVGFPLPGVRVRVVDDHELDLSTGEVGEVWVSGPTRMDGYWARRDLTQGVFRGEWLRTGDLGRLDTEGLLWLEGRIDEVINRGGEKVLPTYVESCVVRLEGIDSASVFGYSDPVLQNRVGVFVTVRAGLVLDEQELRERLRSLLPDYAVPDVWVVRDHLPTTGSGKIDRRAVAREYEELRSARK